MGIFEQQVALNSKEIYKAVSEKAKNILEESGISLVEDIVVKEVKGEDSNSVFRIDCNNHVYALKVFSNSTEIDQFYTNKKFNQLASESNIPIAQIIHSSDDCGILPVPWIFWAWASGKPSCELESKSDRSSVAVQTGGQLKKIHRIKVSGFGYPNAKNEWSGEDIKWTIDFFVSRIRRIIKKGGIAFSEDELQKIVSETSESKGLLLFTKPRLLHGDITGGNVIAHDPKNITLIDPGEIIAGDPMSDLGYSQTTQLSPIFREGIWKGYTKEIPLSVEEHDRFIRWRLLRQCVIACRAVFMKNKNAENYIADTHSFLGEIKKEK